VEVRASRGVVGKAGVVGDEETAVNAVNEVVPEGEIEENRPTLLKYDRIIVTGLGL